MKVIFTLIISIVLCITVSSDLNSQTQARTLSLDEVTTSGQYIARDWIEMQRGFSFTASSPTTMVPKKAKLIWFLANKTLGWKPYLNLNTEQVVGSAITGEINIYTLYATVLDLSNELQEIFTTSAGWAYNVNYNTSNNSVYLEITHPSNFVLSSDYNYEDYEIDDYVPATDGTFTAMIDKNLILDAPYLSEQPNINREPDFSLPVGTIPGMFDVSATGAATYSIPIEVPPGTMGMQPQLAVVYNSQGANGLLGMGFDLSGLSVISRTNKTWYSNNSVSGVTFTSNDIFTLDGNRLVLTSGTYGSPNSVYATENETFSRITAYGIEGNGPEWFKVETKDGKTLEYGKEEDARLSPSGVSTVLAWRLNKVSDANGNYIRFIYRNEENESVISRIEYTGNDTASLEPYNTIEFLYAVKEDSRKAYIGGRYVNQSLILESIRVNHEDDLIREYLFYYTHDVYSHLSEIKLRNGDNERLNSTIFNWGEYNKSVDAADISIPTDLFSEVTLPDRYWNSGDVNGDGIDDLISLFAYDGPLYPNPVNIVKTFNGQESPDGGLIFDDDGSFYLCPHTIPVNNYVRGISSLVLCDLNGDSNHDIVLPYFEDSELGKRIIFYVANGQYPQGIFQQDLGSNVSEMPLYGIRDLDNDGIDDIIYLEKDEISQGSNQYRVKTCYRNTLWQNNAWSSFNLALPGKPERLYIFDFNADGLNDIMVVTAERSVIFKNVNGAIYNTLAISLGTIINTSYGIELGDFNGDGLIDFLCNKNEEWYIAYNNGDFTYRKTLLPQITTEISTERKSDKDFVIVNDFNNDGRSDFVVGDYHMNFTYPILTTTWYASNVYGSYDIDSTATFLATNHDTKRLVNGDFNGDGRAEIVYYGNVLYGNVSQNIGWRSYSSFNENFEEGLLKTVSDGFGRKTKIRYLPLTNTHTPENDTFYDRDDYAIYPVKLMNGPFYCLWKLVNEYNDDLKDSTEYAYGQAKVHAKGAGFLGFMSTSATNSVLNAKTIVESDFETTYYHVKEKSVLVKTASGTSLKRADTDYGIRSWQGRYFSYVIAETKHNFLNNSTSVSRFVYQPDATGNYFTGNVLCDSTDYGDDFIKKNEYKDFVSAGSYTANIPTLVVVTQKHPDDQQTYKSKIRSSYDPANGHLLSTIENYECSGKEVTTTYSDFNPYGQSGKITLAAPGITPKNAYYTYDDRGRFLVEVKDTLGTVSYCNNPVIAKTISVTGINGKTAYSYYDNWGMLEKSTTADSVSSYYKTGWAEGNGPENALYYSITQPEGQPWVKIWYDAKGRVLREESIGFNNISIYTDFTYTSRDEVDLKTTYMGGVVTAQVDYEYFDNGRLQSETYLGGKVVTYQYEGNTVEVTTDNKTYSKTYDKWGNVTNVEEPSPGGQITYTYYSNGKPAQIISPSSTISMAYDAIGNQTMLTDPDAGTIHYGYDALDRLIYQSDNKGNVDSVHYDYAGRIDYKKNNNAKTSYEYIAGGNGIGQLRKVTAPNGSYEQYDYDEYGRTVKSTKHIDNSINDIIFEYSYNEMGQTDTVEYPGNYKVSRSYDNFGNLVRVKNGSTTIWELNQQTASKLKYFLGNNGMYTEKNFDANGFMTSCITKIGNNELQNQHYAFNPVNGLLTSRSDERVNHVLNETFTYDDLYRLTDWDVTRNNQTINYSQTYKPDASGNIGYKSGMGYYDYADNRPHVMDSLTTVAGSPTFNNQAITYTGFNKVYTITENDSVLTITYGPDQQRIKSELTDDGTPVKTWYYGGLYEKEIKAGGATRELLYIPAGDGLAAVYIRNSATGDSLFFLHTDHLGSIVSITDAAGNIIEEYSYDPWGRRRDPLTWELADNPAPERLTRGFTGHEHLDVFGLINMNGRVYDPMLGMFLSPDNYIQAPDFSQNFNRYAYCYNNPLIYTDPSGNYAFLQWIAGGVIGGIANVIQNQDNINSFKDWFVYYNIGNLAGSTGAATSYYGSYGLSYTKIGGALGGMLKGGPAGFVEEFISKSLNSLYEGNSFGSSVDAGWDAGKEGFKWGTALGGLGGGWDAYKQGNNIWTGAETGYGRSQWALNNSNKYTWDIPNTPIMQTQYDCVPTSYSKQLQMLEEPYGYNDLVKSLNYNVNTGYTGSIGDFTDYLGKGTGYSVRLEQVTINKYSNKLMKSLSTQNIPIGHLEKMSQQYWHYSTVKSVTISNAGRVAIRVADPGGFARRVYHGFYFQLIQNYFAY